MTPIVLALLLVTGSGIAFAQEAQSGSPNRVDALKTALASSAKALHQYEWVETTTVSYKGEEKSQKQEQCYYGADGSIVKTALSETSSSKPKHGLRGKIAEKEKDKMAAYMKNAAALVKSYVPPDPEKIQAAKDAGHLTIQPAGDSKNVHIVISDYEKTGDSLSIGINLAKNLPTALTVNTYLDDTSDAVTLDVTMSELENGIVYVSETKLDAKAKHLVVDTKNAGYVKTSE